MPRFEAEAIITPKVDSSKLSEGLNKALAEFERVAQKANKLLSTQPGAGPFGPTGTEEVGNPSSSQAKDQAARVKSAYEKLIKSIDREVDARNLSAAAAKNLKAQASTVASTTQKRALEVNEARTRAGDRTQSKAKPKLEKELTPKEEGIEQAKAAYKNALVSNAKNLHLLEQPSQKYIKGLAEEGANAKRRIAAEADIRNKRLLNEKQSPGYLDTEGRQSANFKRIQAEIASRQAANLAAPDTKRQKGANKYETALGNAAADNARIDAKASLVKAESLAQDREYIKAKAQTTNYLRIEAAQIREQTAQLALSQRNLDDGAIKSEGRARADEARVNVATELERLALVTKEDIQEQAKATAITKSQAAQEEQLALAALAADKEYITATALAAKSREQIAAQQTLAGAGVDYEQLSKKEQVAQASRIKRLDESEKKADANRALTPDDVKNLGGDQAIDDATRAKLNAARLASLAAIPPGGGPNEYQKNLGEAAADDARIQAQSNLVKQQELKGDQEYIAAKAQATLLLRAESAAVRNSVATSALASRDDPDGVIKQEAGAGANEARQAVATQLERQALVTKEDIAEQAKATANQKSQTAKEEQLSLASLAADKEYIKATALAAKTREQIAARQTLTGAGVDYDKFSEKEQVAQAARVKRLEESEKKASVNRALSPDDINKLGADQAQSKATQSGINAARQAQLASSVDYIESETRLQTSNRDLDEILKVRALAAQGVIPAELAQASTLQRSTSIDRQALIATGDKVAAIRRENQVARNLANIGDDVVKLQAETKILTQRYNDRLARAGVALGSAVSGGGAGAVAGAGAGGLLAPTGPPTAYQRISARLRQRPGEPLIDPASQQKAGQFLGQKAFTTAGFALSGAVLFGAVNGIQELVAEGSKLEVTLSQIEAQFKQVGDGAEFDGFRQTIIDISKETGELGSEVALVGMQFKGAFGGTANAAKETEAAVKLAKVAGLSLREVTDQLTSAALAYDVGISRIGDNAIALQEQTGVLAKETINFVSQVGETGKAAGLSIEEVGAIAAIAQQTSGKSGAALSENLNRVLTSVQDNAVKIIGFYDSIPELAPKTDDIAKALGQGRTGDVFLEIQKDYDKLGKGARNTVLELLGGARNAQAIVGVLANESGYVKALSAQFESAGKTTEYFNNLQATLSTTIERLTATFKGLGEELLRGGVSEVLQGFLKALQSIGQAAGFVFSQFAKLNRGLGGFPIRLAVGLVVLRQMQRLLLTTVPLLSGLGSASAGAGAGGLFSKIGNALDPRKAQAYGGLQTPGTGIADAFTGKQFEASVTSSAVQWTAAVAESAAILRGGVAAGAGQKAVAGSVGAFPPGYLQTPGNVVRAPGATYGPAPGIGTGPLNQAEQKSQSRNLGTGALLASIGGSLAIGGIFAGVQLYQSARQKAKAEVDKVTEEFLRKDLKDQEQAINELEGSGGGQTEIGQTVILGTPLGDGTKRIDNLKQALLKTKTENIYVPVAEELAKRRKANLDLDEAIRTLLDTSKENTLANVAVTLGALFVSPTIAGGALDIANAGSADAHGLTLNELIVKAKEEPKKYGKILNRVLKGLAKQFPDLKPLIKDIQKNIAEAVDGTTEVERDANQATLDAEQAQSLYEAGLIGYEKYVEALRARNRANRKAVTGSRGNPERLQEIQIKQAKELADEGKFLSEEVQTRTEGNIQYNERFNGGTRAQGVDAKVASLRDPRVTDPGVINDIVEGIIDDQQVLLKARIDNAKTAAEKLAIARAGISLPAEVGNAILRVQIKTLDETWRNFLDSAFARGLVPIGQDVARFVIDGANAANVTVKQFTLQLAQTEVLKREAFARFQKSLYRAGYIDKDKRDAAVGSAQTARDYRNSLAGAEDYAAPTNLSTPADDVAGYQRDAADEAAEAAKKAAEDAKKAAEDAADLQKRINEAYDALFNAQNARNPVALALRGIATANRHVTEAADEAERINALAERVQADHQLEDAIIAIEDSRANLALAYANAGGRTVEAATIGLQQARKQLQRLQSQGAEEAALNDARSQVASAEANLRDVDLAEKQATIDFNLETKKISTAQAISQYQALLSSADLLLYTEAEKRDLIRKILQLKQGVSQDLQYNIPTELKVPTLYEVRRFLQTGGNISAGRVGGEAGSVGDVNNIDNRQITVTLNTNDPQSAQRAVNQIVDALNQPPVYGTAPRRY